MALAVGLHARGHAVCLVCDTSTAVAVRTTGLPTVCLPPELEQGDIRPRLRYLRASGQAIGPATPNPLVEWAKVCAPTIRAMLEARQPSVLISSLFCLGLADQLASDLALPWCFVNPGCYCGEDSAQSEITVGRRAHLGRHGQGTTARPERRATEVVGSTGRTTDAQDGTPASERPATRRECQPNPSQAVVVRPGNADGPGGKTVWPTNAPVDTLWQVCDDEEVRRLIEPCCSKACQQPWNVGPPPQTPARAAQGHIVFPLRLLARAMAYRLPGEPQVEVFRCSQGVGSVESRLSCGSR